MCWLSLGQVWAALSRPLGGPQGDPAPGPRMSEAPAAVPPRARQTRPSSELVALDLSPGHAHLLFLRLVLLTWVFVL